MNNAKLPCRVSSLVVAMMFCIAGCNLPEPGGSVVQPNVLGSQVDQINQIQEENAELAKLIIYTHEFEINLQKDPIARPSSNGTNTAFDYQGPPRIKGLRLTPAGEDHVRRIAMVLRGGHTLQHMPQVVVQRSETSKKWSSKHQYPVNQNPELDQLRRAVVVAVLESHGVINAEELVRVAPAFSGGLDAIEAAGAYRNATEGREQLN